MGLVRVLGFLVRLTSHFDDSECERANFSFVVVLLFKGLSTTKETIKKPREGSLSKESGGVVKNLDGFKSFLCFSRSVATTVKHKIKWRPAWNDAKVSLGEANTVLSTPCPGINKIHENL